MMRGMRFASDFARSRRCVENGRVRVGGVFGVSVSLANGRRGRGRTDRSRVDVAAQRADKNNPEHAAALEAMREQTRALERSRGTWSRRGVPGVERDWSDVRESAKKTVPAPRSYDAYDEYCR